MRAPPSGWLGALREACDRAGAALIFDEVYTGFGRTGTLFAFQHEGVRPDLLCLGKGMAGGFPISACLGTRAVMEAWGASRGEAIHTQTFLGNPVGCAMALACIDLVVREDLPARAREARNHLEGRLGALTGRGLLAGLPRPDAPALARRLLARGFLALPAGERAEVLAVTPPLNVGPTLLDAFCEAVS
jgi:acetylornithine/succinyldiaminopimelate/putrescine aminotransferase